MTDFYYDYSTFEDLVEAKCFLSVAECETFMGGHFECELSVIKAYPCRTQYMVKRTWVKGKSA